MTEKQTSIETGRLLAFILVVSLLFMQLFHIHLHIYDHQHGHDGHAVHQTASHSNLGQSQPEHHEETTTIEVVQPFIAKILKLQLSVSYAFIACLLFLLFVQFRSTTVRNSTDPFWQRRFLLLPPARAPPCR